VRALALCARAHAALVVADSERVERALGEALELLSGDDPLRAHALTLLGMERGVHRRDHTAARAAFAAALAIANNAGNDALRAYTLAFLAQDQVVASEPADAWATLDEATVFATRSGAKAAWYLDTLRGDAALALNRSAEAVDAHLRSTLSAMRRGDELQTYFDLRGIAEALAAAGCDLAAVETLGLAEGLAAEMNAAGEIPWTGILGDDQLDAARQRAGAASASALAAGRAVPAEQRGVRLRELAATVHASNSNGA
jgi:hypothetical protein